MNRLIAGDVAEKLGENPTSPDKSRTCLHVLYNWAKGNWVSQILITSVSFLFISAFFRFASFLAQFSAVSFGDPLFASFLIVPLTQRHDFKFRRAVWEEHVGVLRALSIPLDQVKCKADVVIWSSLSLTLGLAQFPASQTRENWGERFGAVTVVCCPSVRAARKLRRSSFAIYIAFTFGL